MTGLLKALSETPRDPMTMPWLAWVVVVLGSFMVLEFIGHRHYGRPGTLSAHIQVWSNVHPLVPFGLGCVVGALAFHFWQQPQQPPTP